MDAQIIDLPRGKHDTVPYREGKAAGATANDVGGLEENPYPKGSDESVDWVFGWCTGFARHD